MNQLEPLTEQQLVGIGNLQQSSQQAEDALSQGMEALQQSLAETLSSGSLGSSGSGNVANYMGQMAMAMGKLGTLEGFIRQVPPFPLSLSSKSFRAHLSNMKFVIQLVYVKWSLNFVIEHYYGCLFLSLGYIPHCIEVWLLTV